MKNDFSAAVQSAYSQGLVCRNALIAKENRLVGSNGETIVLPETIVDAFVICLTLDTFPALTHMLDTLLAKHSEDPFPIAVSVFDLDIMACYLADPFEFLYYLRQRTTWTTHYKAMSEMPL